MQADEMGGGCGANFNVRDGFLYCNSIWENVTHIFMLPEAAFMNAQFLRLDRIIGMQCNVYITNQSQTTFARGGGGGILIRGDCE
jgi:hypothetical protein